MNAVARQSLVPPPDLFVSSPESFAVATPVDLTDHELMLAVRDGEIRRLGDLFERHNGPLFGYFVRMTSNRATSEDLVQLVFYRILKYRHTYRDEGKFTAWMYHLARKVAADHFRKRQNAETMSDDGAELETIRDDTADTAEQAARDDDIELMRRAFQRLPVDQREILTLHRFQHLPHEDIARLLDCSVGAAKVRLHRAIKSLRDVYLRLNRHGASR